MCNLMIVDDEPNVLYSFEKTIGQHRDDVQITTAETGAAAIDAFEHSLPDAVILDVCLPDMSGLDVFKHFYRIAPAVPVIVVTAHASTDMAIEATKQGAFDFLVKPVDIGLLREAVDRCLQHSEQEDSSETFTIDRSKQPVHGIVGQSVAMQGVYKFIGRVAPENVTVLVLGESGTGKELVATEIFRHSQRRTKPFLVINCAALSETLLESELFGHEKGAFTGADSRHHGKFEQAHGGTLFMDEIGDMSMSTQAKVLRVLQDGKFERVGGNKTITTDVRLVCATNHDLEQRIEQGLFRRDLLYRLNGFSVHLPPLRDRRDDLLLLIEHFVKVSNEEFDRPVAKISPDALTSLLSYHWPGNVRELQSVIQFAVLHSLGDTLTQDALPDLLPPEDFCGNAQATNRERDCKIGLASTADSFGRPRPDPTVSKRHLTIIASRVRELLESNEPDLFRKLIRDAELAIIQEALDHHDGNQVKASRALGISRTTLRGKLARDGE